MDKNKKFLILSLLLLLTISLVGCSSSVLASFLEELTLPSTTEINLDLEETYHYKGKEIKVRWSSSNPDAINSQGEVNRQEYNQEAILICEASLGSSTAKKTFFITVIADTDEQTLTKVISNLYVPSSVSKNIQFPTTKTMDGKEVQISWKSDNPSVLTDEGLVTCSFNDVVVNVTATFSLNSHSLSKTYTITVLRDESYLPENYYHTLDVYTGDIGKEAAPEEMREFAGALYRKVQSNRDYWLGIEVIVTLPEFKGDEGRTGTNTLNGHTYQRYLDNASVYLGGNIQYECDIGLTWSIGATADCSAVYYDESVAFRPFWRYITTEGKNVYKNAQWNQPQFYYYPGDKVRMSVFVSRENYMKLRIELLEETTIPKYVQKRASYNLGEDYDRVFLSPEFESQGAGKVRSVFKRVCALDQVNNEAKPTQPTNASSKNTIWHEVYLYRNVNGSMYKIPMNNSRTSSICSPSGSNSLGNFTGAFKISYDGVNMNLGGEVVTIDPQNRK